MRQTQLALALSAVFVASACADTLPEYVGDTIVVTPTRMPLADTTAPFASEVHSLRMIEQSGAVTLYDYLAQHTSLLVLPYFGNKAVPQIDMRGDGMENGHQNIVVTVDGRRLNNVDMVPQLLGSIPLADIERIEITKGSGSVMFGDGATAGTIQIITRNRDGASAKIAAGNYGARNATLAAGLNREAVSLSVSADYANLDGTSEPDMTGQRDASLNRTVQGKLEVRPLDGLTLNLDGGRSRIDTRYVDTLTLAEYEANPAQNGGNIYTHQKFESNVWGAGAAYAFTPHWKLGARYHQEDKLSDFISFAFKADYDYRSGDLALEYRGDALSLTLGGQAFDGERIGSFDRTSKDNRGLFVQTLYRLGATTLSAGARAENVGYTYAPAAGAPINSDDTLYAWDIGVNQQLDDGLFLFANLNQAFQAPDIDRFFDWGGTFNAFISPEHSRSLTAGLNHVASTNRMKLVVFYAKVTDEIYFNPVTFINTNLDKTHKYGLELQDSWQMAPSLAASLNYAYTRAMIDREDSGSGAYDGKELPGVPRHGVNLGLNWRITPASGLNLMYAWRAETWATEDFDNNNVQKQQVYQSTSLAYQYRHQNWEWFAAVDNVFEQTNGIWIRDDAIYPVSFTRNWRLGMTVDF